MAHKGPVSMRSYINGTWDQAAATGVPSGLVRAGPREQPRGKRPRRRR